MQTMHKRSHPGILIYVNFYSNRQNTVESSSFGLEFVALITATEIVESIRYKLRKFGVNLEGPAEVYCYNNSVVENSSVPVSVLNKRQYYICYHRVR